MLWTGPRREWYSSPDWRLSARRVARRRMSAFTGDGLATRIMKLAKRAHRSDFWSDADLGDQDGDYAVQLPARPARVICGR